MSNKIKNLLQKKASIWLVVAAVIITPILTLAVRDLFFARYYYKTDKECGPLKNGLPEGLWKFYDFDGSLIKEGTFVNGKPLGLWKYYNNCGDVVFTDVINTSSKGKKYVVVYWPSGRVRGVFYGIKGCSFAVISYDMDGFLECFDFTFESSSQKSTNILIEYDRNMNIRNIKRSEFVNKEATITDK